MNKDKEETYRQHLERQKEQAVHNEEIDRQNHLFKTAMEELKEKEGEGIEFLHEDGEAPPDKEQMDWFRLCNSRLKFLDGYLAEIYKWWFSQSQIVRDAFPALDAWKEDPTHFNKCAERGTCGLEKIMEFQRNKMEREVEKVAYKVNWRMIDDARVTARAVAAGKVRLPGNGFSVWVENATLDFVKSATAGLVESLKKETPHKYVR